jgi:hypothetical protein
VSQNSDTRPAKKRDRSAACKQDQDSIKKSKRSTRKCNRVAPTPTRPGENPWALRALLRRVHFINAQKSRYVSIGLYPAHDYQVLSEFGGSRSQSITLTSQHVKTLAEHLPELYDAVYLGKRYRYKDGEFKLQCSGTDSVVRLYLNKRFVTLKIVIYVI